MRVLTKSRFKEALSCPNKLFYTKKKEYANSQLEDPFLQALAEGGFQVEELSRLYYPNGHLIEGLDWDYQALANTTSKLLEQENVIIYEAAFLFDNLFIRTDILVKKGNKIELIEVKAKSFDPNNNNTFLGKNGGIVSSWKAYLFDLAFQKYVTQHCLPNCIIKAKLMLADKTKYADVDGLNQLFRISKNKTNRTGIIKKINDVSGLGQQLISAVDVDYIINEIIIGKHEAITNMNFNEVVNYFNKIYQNNQYINWPISWSCKQCEFKASKDQKEKGLLSGFEECFSKQLGWSTSDFKKPNIFEIWNFRGNKLFEQGKIFLEDLEPGDINVKVESDKLSSSERQFLQVKKAISNDLTTYVLKDQLAEEMSSWQFPLNFIDFETSTVALPMFKGMHPYEQIAFQFSHHLVFEDGRIVHFSEYINTTPGSFPNFDFLRALKRNLETNVGSIFRYSTHENTILNAIYDQLLVSDEIDKIELCNFIKVISTSKSDRVESWKGERNMIDLCEIIKKYYYNPYTKGSNSIKFVLPAILNTSKHLQNKYAQPINNIGVKSKNFDKNHIWLSLKKDVVINPYKMLPPLFKDWSEEQLKQTLSGIENIDNGGQALTAYAKLQYVDMSNEEREVLKKSLLKYCELDTLAMVMIYEELNELIKL